MTLAARLWAGSASVALLICLGPAAYASTPDEGSSAATESASVGEEGGDIEEQEGQEAEEAEKRPYILDKITVTAQKRPETLQEVPLAITAFDAETLEEERITSIDEVYLRTPGFSFGQFNAVQPQLYIRGIGSTDDSASGDNSVVVFIDEVYVGRAGAFDIDLYDLERVEVLRGPQGTLYGKNVVGGAVNILTKKPTSEVRATVELTGGNYDRKEFFGSAGGPITDNAFGKLSVNRRDREGYTLHALTGNHLLDDDSLSGRGQLEIRPSDQLDVSFIIDYQEDDLAGNAREPRGEPFIFFPWFLPPFPSSPDPFVAELNTDGFQDREVGGFSAHINWQSAIGTLTSITAFRTSEFKFQEDFDGTPQGLIVDNVDEDADQFTQEIRLADTSDNGRWIWVAGAYFLREEVDREDFNDFSGNDDGIAAFFGIPPGALPSFKVTYDQLNETTSMAGFGQATLAVSDRANFTFGGRYTYEEKDAELAGLGFDPVGSFLQEPYAVSVNESWDDFSPKATVDIQVGQNNLFYFTVARGFKSGGFNGSSNSGESARVPFDPETATNFEAGIKTTSGGNRMFFNAAAFRIDYSDLQVFQLVDGTRLVIDNAADATSQGLELELAARPFQGLDINASYAYLDAEYDEFIDESGADFSGNRLTRAPENSGSFGVRYSFPAAEAGVFTIGGDYLYQDEIFFDPDNFELVGDDGHSLVNARLAFETANGSWRFTAWGKNLTDEFYYIHGIDGRGPFGLSQNASMVVGAPRMYGLSVAWRTR